MKVSNRYIVRRCATVTAVVLVMACIGWWLKDHYRWHRRFGVVSEGVLLRSSLPTEEQLDDLKHEYKVQTIISLLTGEELRQYPECKVEMEFVSAHGVRFVHMPLSVPRPEQIREFFDIVNSPENQPVLIHCHQGTVRTGILVALYRMENHGWKNEDALEEMISYGFEPDLPKYRAITEFVMNYRPKSALAGKRDSDPVNPAPGSEID